MNVLEDDPRCSICGGLRWFQAGGWVCEDCDEQAWQGQGVAMVQFRQGVPDEFVDEHWDAVEQVAASRFFGWRAVVVDWPTWVYTVGWVVWLLLFGVLEFVAVALDRDRGDTLSEHVWWLIFEPAGRPRPVVFFLFAGFLVWLVIHFLARGRFG